MAFVIDDGKKNCRISGGSACRSICSSSKRWKSILRHNRRPIFGTVHLRSDSIDCRVVGCRRTAVLFFGVFYPTPTFRIRSAAVILCEIPAPLVQHEYLAWHKKRIRENCSALMIPFSSVLFLCVCLCDRYCTRLYLVQWHFSCSASQYAIKVSENVHLFECFFLLFLFAKPACKRVLPLTVTIHFFTPSNHFLLYQI